VILGRPVHVYRFIADLLDVELAQRTFDDIMYGCALKKSKRLEPYPTESCILMSEFIKGTKAEVYGEDQFLMGPIPDYELEKPALDRYRDYAGIGVFDMTCCDLPPEPEAIGWSIQIGGWFGVAVTAFVTSTKLSYLEPGWYWDW